MNMMNEVALAALVQARQEDAALDLGNLRVQTELKCRQRNKIFSDATLFERTAESILKNQDFFCKLFERTGINPIEKISKSMRVALIERKRNYIGSYKIESHCTLLTLLMNDQVSSVSFSYVPRTEKEAMKIVSDMWLVMSNECPNLQELVCEEDSLSTPGQEDPSKQVVLLGLALYFKELQVLEMPNTEFNNFRLEIVAENLPKLRVLYVDFGPKVTPSGFAALTKLEHLQEFLFHTYLQADTNEGQRYLRYYRWCLQLLPWLQIVGSQIQVQLCFNYFPSNWYERASATLKRRLPSQVGLRQLVLNEASGMPVGVTWPNLERLQLVRPREDFRFAFSLSSLTQLALLDVQQLVLERILSFVGGQLLKLSVVVLDVLHLDRVFRWCPNLQVFYIPMCPRQFIGLSKPLEVMDGITEMGLVQEFREHGTSTALSTQELMQVLQACPNVRILRLENAVFTEEGGMEICRALEERSILQHLEQLSAIYDWPRPGRDAEMLRIKRNCFTVLQCMNRLCPKLIAFKPRGY